MKTQKTKLTNRKFYNKWLYKVSLHIGGAAIFRYKGLEAVQDLCVNLDPNERPYSVSAKAYANKDVIYKLAELLRTFDQDLWSKRIENSRVDIYTNSLEIYNSVSDIFEDLVLQKFEPDLDKIDLLNDSQSVILAKKLPHGIYNYKAYLLPHKMAGDKEGKMQYVNWLKKQYPKVTCTEAVEKWFVTTDWNWDRRYILVEDESMLLMLKLRNPDVVGRIYNYQLCDK
jgi:hypothetical protein